MIFSEYLEDSEKVNTQFFHTFKCVISVQIVLQLYEKGEIN